MSDTKRFKLPSFNLVRITKLIDNVLAGLRKHYATTPTGPAFDAFVQDLIEFFPGVRYDTIFASVMHLAGRPIDRDTLYFLAWRLAANIDRLRRGIPVPPWSDQREEEWCPVEFVEANHGQSFTGKPGYFITYRILAGTPAGMLAKTFLPGTLCYLIARDAGYTTKRSRFKFKFASGKEIVGLRTCVHMVPERSSPEKPGFDMYQTSSSLRAYNREILKQRFRLIPCPLDYRLDEMPCHRCPQGYDNCRAAVHPYTYKLQGCPGCNEEKFFDFSTTRGLCIDCESGSKNNEEKK